MDKVKVWLKGREWYRPEYRKVCNAISYITICLATLFILNIKLLGIDALTTLLFGALLSCACIVITLSYVDKHESKLRV